MRATVGRANLWSWVARAGLVALSLALAQGCADIWGFSDLTPGSDGGLDATTSPESGVPVGDAGEGGRPPTADGGVTVDAAPDAGAVCAPPGTILSCGGCNQACDVVQSNGPACANNATCTYRDCAAGWQDCDKTAPNTNGCESSTTSTSSCGACGKVCDTAHSIGATCVESADAGITCQYSGCQPGWADCDTSAPDTDGCETSLSTAANCGACGKACDTMHSQGATCNDGTTCSYTGCSPGYLDCDTTAPDTNGCEKQVTTATCSSCGTSCDTIHSNGGTCDADAGSPTCKYTSCAAGYADCNNTPPDTNGCETSITTPANCGACGRSCDTKTSVGPACAGGDCTYSGCAMGFANCDTTPPDTNGCESSLFSTATCGACKNAACNTKTGAASCNGMTCAYKCNAGLTDCNAATAPDTDGCECATPGCCSGNCQTTHSNGVGESFFDCNANRTYNAAQAQEACEAYAGAGRCLGSQLCCALGVGGICLLGSTATSVCGAIQGQCFCWQYAGPFPGTVQAVSGKCTAACGASTDSPWN